MKLRIWLTRIVLPLIKLISKLGKPQPRRNYDDFVFITANAQPGDVLLCREDLRLSNILIKGYWSHAAIVVSNNYVLEAVPPKVRLTHLSQFVMSCDSICLLRPKFKIEYTDYSNLYLGAQYDFWFLGQNEMWFCSELVTDFLSRISPNQDFKFRKQSGLHTTIPDDFWLAADKFERLYENR